MTIYTSVKDELELLNLVRNSPYNQIYRDGEYYIADLYDGTVTLATTMQELRIKLQFIASTELV